MMRITSSHALPPPHTLTPGHLMLQQLLRRSLRAPIAVARCLSTVAASPFQRHDYGLFIDGEQVPSRSLDSRLQVENPATTESLAWIAAATREDVDRAVAGGQAAFASGAWSRASTTERARVLHAIAAALRARLHEFAEKESLQTGRPIREMRAQLTRLPGAFIRWRRRLRELEDVRCKTDGWLCCRVVRVLRSADPHGGRNGAAVQWRVCELRAARAAGCRRPGDAACA